MKYFKDENNSVYAFESDGSQDDYIKPNYVEIDATEALNLAKPKITHEQLIAINTAKKSSLLAIASEQIATLTDAVDLDMATEEESAALLAWKKYRVLLNRVDTSTALDIDWPVAPDARE